jgi:hypothetical protein
MKINQAGADSGLWSLRSREAGRVSMGAARSGFFNSRTMGVLRKRLRCSFGTSQTPKRRGLRQPTNLLWK